MAKQKTIGDLRIGDCLLFGRYSVDNDNGTPDRILWIKIAPGRFITKYVIDYLKYDELEPDDRYGRRDNSNYETSNILQYLNSCGDAGHWFTPQHPGDVAPQMARYYHRAITGYDGHYGFLNKFEDYEQNVLDGAVGLPYAGEIVPVDRMSGNHADGVPISPYFARHGIRARGSDDFVRLKLYTGYSDVSYIPYYTRTELPESTCVVAIDRSGYTERGYPSSGYGIRPVCCINEDAPVRLCENTAIYEIVEQTHTYQTKNLSELFGI